MKKGWVFIFLIGISPHLSFSSVEPLSPKRGALLKVLPKKLKFKFLLQEKIECPLTSPKIKAVLKLKEGEKVDFKALKDLGVKVISSAKNLLEVEMPQNVWKEIPKKVKGIAYVREPYQPIPQVTSEGVAKIGAVEYQNNAGITGKNVKVAVIDVGFIGLSAAQAAGELPSSVITQDYTGDGIEATSAHGVAVSEIIYDIAPDASFYLIKIANDVHFKEAIEEWCIPQGIKIINLSLGWLAVNFCDGTGDICNTANSARTNGILFIQAMGNYAQRHYQGIFTPYVFSGYTVHDFDETADVDISNAIYATAGSLIRAYLTWDAWPSTAEDYDLWLGYVSNGTLYIVAWSQNRQATGEYPAPREMLSYNVTVTRWYHLLICY